MRLFTMPVAVAAIAVALFLSPANGGAADGTVAVAPGAGHAHYGGDYAPATAPRPPASARS